MKHRIRTRGFSLIETVVAIGVLAIAVPLALAALTQTSSVGATARSETRAPLIAERCLLELKAAREGRSEVIMKLQPQNAFPSEGEVLALAFSRYGKMLGAVEAEAYQAGIEKLGEETVAYVVRLSGRVDEPGLLVTVEVEYPSARAAEDRASVNFHTKLP